MLLLSLHTRAQEVPEILRRVLALGTFRTRSRRLGKMVRVSRQRVQYYTTPHTPELLLLAQSTAPGAGRLEVANARLAGTPGSSSNALASCKSAVSNPSVNQM